LGWSDGLPKAIGNGQKQLGRATPTILNAAYNPHQFWDGRAKTLEEQALGPIGAAGEMNQNLDQLVSELSGIQGYKNMFNKAYPNEGITKQSIAKAIASFERTVVSKESRFDRFVKGDKKALSKAEQNGFSIFEGKGRCASCHSGFNFTDNRFHNIGLKDKDPGRAAVVKDKSLTGAVKTPTLRDISLTAPYMHNGSLKTLEAVVDHYNKGGVDKSHLSPMMAKLDLSKKEKSDLVAFLKTLTSEPSKVTIPRLPN
jgi:cytochrome c peroxidase